MGTDKRIIVSLVGNTVQCDPDPIPSFSSHQDTLHWHCDDGDLLIAFDKDGTPFENGAKQFTARIHDPRTRELAKVAKSGRGETHYHYSVQVTPPGGDPITADPIVIIDPGIVIVVGGPGDALRLLGDADAGAREAAKDVMHNLLADLMVAAPSKADAPKFFPNGIELISVDVEVGAVKVIVKVAGPKAPSD